MCSLRFLSVLCVSAVGWEARVPCRNGLPMAGVELLWKGLAAGVAIAAPVGPVNVLVISRAIEKGWRSGLVSGVGAALADTLYGSIAGFSITLVIDFLMREEKPLRMVGGLLLMAIALVYARKKPQ